MKRFIVVVIPYGEYIIFPAEFAEILPHMSLTSRNFSSEPYKVDSEQPLETHILPASRVQFVPDPAADLATTSDGSSTPPVKPKDDMPF